MEAWAWILHAHGAAILTAAQRILLDEALAEDACQETLLQIRDRAAQFKGAGPNEDAAARNWIMRIACNTALHLLRQRRRARRREELQVRECAVSVELEKNDKEDLAKLVRHELAAMPEKQRRALVLHFYGGLNYAQLAEELRCGVGAARVRVHRALKQLRERLAIFGILLSAGALVALLEYASNAGGLNALLSPERIERWQALLCSSQLATINVLADGQFPWLAKTGAAAAAALLCGSVAWGAFDKKNETPQGASAAKPLQVRSDDARPAAVLRDMTRKEETRSRPNAPPHPTRSFEAALAKRSVAPKVCEDAGNIRPRLTRERLVSPVAQLQLLCTLQHELNARIAGIYRAGAPDGRGGAALTAEQREALGRAADEQAQLARLAETLAKELKGQQHVGAERVSE